MKQNIERKKRYLNDCLEQEFDDNEIVSFYPKTGEVIDNAIVTTPDDLKRKKEFFKRKERKLLSRSANENECFIQYLFNEFKGMTDLSPRTAIRLMYLSTYLSYDENYLKTGRNIISHAKMQELMALKSETFRLFLKEVTEKGYLTKDDKGYSLCKEHFNKGKTRLGKPCSEKRFVRVYINALRKLYLSTSQNRHSYLGYIFQIIPYVNMQWNIVCYNPLETDRDKIKPMTLGEFCDAIGYSRAHANRLIKTLREIKFHWRDKEQLFCSYIYEANKCDMKFFVNPNIFYAGDNFNEVEVLGMFF